MIIYPRTNEDYEKITNPTYISYTDAIMKDGKMLWGCANSMGVYKRCQEAYSDLAHLCGAFDRREMFSNGITQMKEGQQ